MKREIQIACGKCGQPVFLEFDIPENPAEAKSMGEAIDKLAGAVAHKRCVEPMPEFPESNPRSNDP